ncbi:MAG: PorV/PorQ family protein [Ignavibacteria bacterium]
MKRVIYFSILFSSIVLAQSKVATTIGQFLKIEPSAKISAFGGSGTGQYGTASSLFYNPASLGRIQNIDADFSIVNWFADIKYNYGAVAINTGELGTFALQIISLNSGEIPVRTVEMPLGTGEKYSVTNFALGIGYGRMLTDRVSVGLIVSYFNETIWHSSLNGFFFNFGVQYQINENGMTFGASVSNYGTHGKFSGTDLFINYDFDPRKYGDNDRLPAELRTDEFTLPTIFRAGLSYPIKLLSNYKLILSVDALHPNDNYESIAIGGELKFFDAFSIRGGYRNLFLADREGGLTLGAGADVNVLNSYHLRFDYSWVDYGRLKAVHRITFGLNI